MTLAELSAKATPGEWIGHPVKGYAIDNVYARNKDGTVLAICADGEAGYRDAPLIVELRNALPEIIAALRSQS